MVPRQLAGLAWPNGGLTKTLPTIDHWFGRGSFHHRQHHCRRLTGTWNVERGTRNVEHSARNMGISNPLGSMESCDGIYASYTGPESRLYQSSPLSGHCQSAPFSPRTISFPPAKLCRPHSSPKYLSSHAKKFKRQNSDPDPAAWVVVDQTALRSTENTEEFTE